MKCKRLLCLLLTVLMLCSLVPETTFSDTTVYFTAVNDQLLSLSDDTMPFWSGGRLYLSSTAAAAGFFRMSFTLLSRENAIRIASFSLILW